MPKKSKKRQPGEPKRKGVQLAEAIGVFEGAFRRGAPNEVEQQLREMVNVQVVVAESKGAFEKYLLKEDQWPEMITLPYGVFLGKVREKRLNVYKIDLTALKEKSKTMIREDAGVFFRWEVVFSCQDISEALPGRSYLLLADQAGYSEEKGLTFEGIGGETGWVEKGRAGVTWDDGGRYQSFQEHSTGVYQCAQEVAKLYEPSLHNWAQQTFASIEGADPKVIAENLLEAICLAALFHDIGKLNRQWQQAVGWEEGKELIGRTETKEKHIQAPKHAPYAYVFVKMLLREYFGTGDKWGRILDHIALAAARHHGIGVRGDIEPDFDPIPEAEKVLEELGKQADIKEGLVYEALEALKQEAKAEESPGPSDDLYFVYCLAQRLIKMADWEDARHKQIELAELRS